MLNLYVFRELTGGPSKGTATVVAGSPEEARDLLAAMADKVAAQMQAKLDKTLPSKSNPGIPGLLATLFDLSVPKIRGVDLFDPALCFFRKDAALAAGVIRPLSPVERQDAARDGRTPEQAEALSALVQPHWALDPVCMHLEVSLAEGATADLTPRVLTFDICAANGLDLVSQTRDR